MAGAGDEREDAEWENAPQGVGNEAANRLPFENDSDRLPWLEADDEQYEYQGNDVGRLIGFFLLGLVILATLVGGIWWATHRQNDPTLVADGSIVDGPEQPYKEVPADPGGKTFQGTGDSSFAVSAGKTPGTETTGNGMEVSPEVAALGKETPQPAASPTVYAPKPTPKPSATATPAVKPTPAPGFASAVVPAPTVAETGVSVQVGAYSNRVAAEAGWKRLQQKSNTLNGMRYRIVEGQADIGKVFRLQALPGDRSAAQGLCRSLKGEGIACQVKN